MASSPSLAVKSGARQQSGATIAGVAAIVGRIVVSRKRVMRALVTVGHQCQRHD